VVVGGHARGTPAILPVTRNDLLAPARQYHDWVAAGLNTLAGQAGALAADVRTGNLGAARTAWLTAHLTYQRLGAAYDAFGDLGDEIDGLPDSQAGVHDPDWTGFHRLEYGLWHGQGAGQLTGVANKLVADIRGLRASWPDQEIDLIDMGLRTHEILENALQFQLSGHDDYGSGTTLATTQANIDGTRELLTILHPLLAPRYAGLPAVDSWLDRLQSLIGKERRPNGTWVSVSALSTSQRQQIDAACSQALEALAPIAAITEPPIRLANIPVRCGFSQRLPMLVISPWSRTNYVSHQLTNTASIIRFAENNWLGGKRIGGGSFDAISNSLSGMLQFFAPHFNPVVLDPTTGAVARN
jgi:hypothetical protein